MMIYMNITLAVVAILSLLVNLFLILQNQRNFERNFEAEHRPYVFINSKMDIFYPQDKPNWLGFAVSLLNSGKSAGNNIDFTVKKAILLDSSPTEEDNKNLFNDDYTTNTLELISPPQKQVLSMFPQQSMVLGNFFFEKAALQELWKVEHKIIYVLAELSYKGPPYGKVNNDYKINYIIVLFMTEEGKILTIVTPQEIPPQ